MTGRPPDVRQHFAGTRQHGRSLRGDWDETSFYPSAALRGLSSLLAKEVTDPRTCGRAGRGSDGVSVGTAREKEGALTAAWPASQLLPSRSSRWGEPRGLPAWGAEPPLVVADRWEPLTQAGEPRAWEPGDERHREAPGT